jgi:hypothetical protein
MTDTGRIRAAAFLSVATMAVLGLSSCGGGSTLKQKRPPVPIQLSGVITSDRVTVAPRRLGAGPIILLVSNQTEQSHTVTLDGQGVRERVGPINPRDTATLQKTLAPGRYTIKAGSASAVPREIKPASLSIGRARPSANDRLLLP